MAGRGRRRPAVAILDRLRTDALQRAHLTLSDIETYTLVRDAADTRVALTYPES